MVDRSKMILKPLISMDIVITEAALRSYGETMMGGFSPCPMRDEMARLKLEHMLMWLDGVEAPRQSIKVDGIRLVIVHRRLIYAGTANTHIPFRPPLQQAEASA